MSKKKRYAVLVPFGISYAGTGSEHLMAVLREFSSLQLAKKEQRKWSSALIVEVITGEIK